MKLLICVTEYYPYGAGIANRVYNVVLQLKKLGINCTVCSPTGPDIKLGSSNMISKYGILGLLHYWQQIAKYFKNKTHNYDLVWLNYPLFITNNPFPKSLITIDSTAYGKSIKKIFALPRHLYYKLASKIEKYSLRKANHGKTRFSILTPQLLNELENLGIPKRDIVCILNGVDPKRFKPSNSKGKLRKIFNLPENEIILLSLGRLSDVKQPYKLIELFSIIEKKSKDITLVIAGKGELSEKTKRMVRQKGLRKVKFLGHVDYWNQVPNLYAASDYFIMTSKYEGLPLVLLDAMACGLPCIVSRIPSLKLVEEANCGIAIDIDDLQTSSKTILKYMNTNNSEHSKNAREYAIRNFTWKMIAQQYLKELENLLDKRN